MSHNIQRIRSLATRCMLGVNEFCDKLVIFPLSDSSHELLVLEPIESGYRVIKHEKNVLKGAVVSKDWVLEFIKANSRFRSDESNVAVAKTGESDSDNGRTNVPIGSRMGNRSTEVRALDCFERANVSKHKRCIVALADIYDDPLEAMTILVNLLRRFPEKVKNVDWELVLAAHLDLAKKRDGENPVWILQNEIGMGDEKIIPFPSLYDRLKDDLMVDELDWGSALDDFGSDNWDSIFDTSSLKDKFYEPEV